MRLAAPLTPDYRNVPLWHDALASSGGASALPASADVVVVGAGYCGLAAARELALHDRQTLVVEAEDLGRGASTRNAGMVIPELKHGLGALRRRYGALASELVGAVQEAFDLVERLIRECRIDCDYRRSGGLLLAHHVREVAPLRQLSRELADDLGEHARFVTREELRGEIGTDAYFGAVIMERVAGLHPARYHAGLVRAAREAGAVLHEHTRVLAIEERTGGFSVRTTRGTVEADDVLVATNAYVDGSCRALQRRVLPVGSFILATEPLPPELANELVPHDRMCFDTRHLVRYWRRSPDSRLLFGGRAGLSATTVEQARDALYGEMLRMYPQLDGTRVARAWGGSVAVTRDRLPHCGRLDGVGYATGCNGSGVALATWFGLHMARWLCGEPPPVFSQLPFPRIPMHRCRRMWLPAAGWVLRGLDGIGR